ncbi:hypothetical protein GQ53DRAFT_848862 [Thozetella sp. PMI_491]|nr:hypothetical protein GQ53DRAFT_848862 [Thozetella sp. PMI_491]
MSADSFFSLPGEVRNAIYSAYLTLERGYFFDFHTNKLATADHQSIELALLSTGKLVAQETKGLAFRLNTVTFSTIYSKDFESESKSLRILHYETRRDQN